MWHGWSGRDGSALLHKRKWAADDADGLHLSHPRLFRGATNCAPFHVSNVTGQIAGKRAVGFDAACCRQLDLYRTALRLSPELDLAAGEFPSDGDQSPMRVFKCTGNILS